MRGDVGQAQQLGRALEIARRFGDRDLEALTLHNQVVCISVGEWKRAGDRRVAAAAAAGALWPTATGSVWTISTCRDLQEVRRAGEWTARRALV